MNSPGKTHLQQRSCKRAADRPAGQGPAGAMVDHPHLPQPHTRCKTHAGACAAAVHGCSRSVRSPWRAGSQILLPSCWLMKGSLAIEGPLCWSEPSGRPHQVAPPPLRPRRRRGGAGQAHPDAAAVHAEGLREAWAHITHDVEEPAEWGSDMERQFERFKAGRARERYCMGTARSLVIVY